MTKTSKKNKYALAVASAMHRTFAADAVCELSTLCDVGAGGWLAPEGDAMEVIDATENRIRTSLVLRNEALCDEARRRLAPLLETARGVGPAPDVVIMVFSDLSCLIYATGRNPAAMDTDPGGARPPRMMLLDPQPRAFPRSIRIGEDKKLFSFVDPNYSGVRTTHQGAGVQRADTSRSAARSLATTMARRDRGRSGKTLCLGRPGAWMPFDMASDRKTDCATMRNEQPPIEQSICEQSICEQSICEQSICEQSIRDALTTAAAGVAGAIPDLPAAYPTDASGVRRLGSPPHAPFPPFLGHQSWTGAEKAEVSGALRQVMRLHASEGYTFVEGLSDADRESLPQQPLGVKFVSGLGGLADTAEEGAPRVRILAPSGVGSTKDENLAIAKKVETAVSADLAAVCDTSIFIGACFLARTNAVARFGPAAIIIVQTFLAKGQAAETEKLSGHEALRLRRRIEEAKAASGLRSQSTGRLSRSA